MKTVKTLTLNSPSKYNPSSKRWTIFVANEDIWYMYGQLEEKIFEFERKYSPNSVTEETYLYFMQIELYKKILKTLRTAALNNKNHLSITKTEAFALSKIDSYCKGLVSRIL